MTDKQRLTFELENISNTKTAFAWRMRENFMAMYECQTSEQALDYFNAWYKSVIHSSNQHIKKAAKTIKEHIGNMISQIGSTISNGRAEQTNSKIAKIQRMAQGYHNFDNLRAQFSFSMEIYPYITRLTIEPFLSTSEGTSAYSVGNVSTGTKNLTIKKPSLIYSNPVHGIAYVIETVQQATLHSLSGEIIKGVSNSNEISVAGLSGIYLLRIMNTNGNIYNNKLVVE